MMTNQAIYWLQKISCYFNTKEYVPDNSRWVFDLECDKKQQLLAPSQDDRQIMN